MNLICWNCRGTASKGFAGLIRDMKRDYSSSFIALLETHSSGNQAKRIVRRIGFENHVIRDARGQSGGIWLLWDSNFWNISVIKETNQLVHVEVKVTNSSSWYLTIVYGSPHYTPRQSLWDDLQSIHLNINGPWAIIGDFNAILKDHERAGPPLVRPLPRENGIHNTLDRCNLLDLGFNGNPFTWERLPTRKRLDRAISNLDWRLRFEQANIFHLPKFKSDHTPLLLIF